MDTQIGQASTTITATAVIEAEMFRDRIRQKLKVERDSAHITPSTLPSTRI